MEVSEGEDQAVEAIVEGEIMEMIEGENKSLTFDLAMPDKIARKCCCECLSCWPLSHYYSFLHVFCVHFVRPIVRISSLLPRHAHVLPCG